METLALPGRILYLAATRRRSARSSPGAGWRGLEAGALRDDVSTDEITPVPILTHYDDKLGRYPYTGFSAGDARPIGVDAIRAGGFEVTVAGKRYGKGSSREHSPAAERLAGIRLVDRRELRAHLPPERRQHRPLHLDRLRPDRAHPGGRGDRRRRAGRGPRRARRGDPEERRTAALRPALHARRRAPRAEATARARRARCSRRSSPAMRWRPSSRRRDPRAGRRRLRARRLALHPRVLHRHVRAHAARRPSAGRWRCTTRRRIVVFEDHTSYVDESPAHVRGGLVPNVHRDVSRRSARSSSAYGLRTHRTLTEAEAAADDGSNVAGISHAMMAEHYALPGQVVVGTDSHTPHSGALGCVAFGVGTTDMANAFVTGAVRLTVPADRCASSSTGSVPAGRDRQGHRAAPAGAAGDPRRRRRRQGVRVRRRRSSRARRPTSAPRSPT